MTSSVGREYAHTARESLRLLSGATTDPRAFSRGREVHDVLVELVGVADALPMVLHQLANGVIALHNDGDLTHAAGLTGGELDLAVDTATDVMTTAQEMAGTFARMMAATVVVTTNFQGTRGGVRG